MQNIPPKLIIAIDGHSSSGKSTVAKALAHKLNYKYIDTGAMYRAITYKLLKNKISFNDLDAIISILENTTIDFHVTDNTNEVLLDGVCIENKIRSLVVSNSVSEVATIPEIRKHLVKIQQKISNEGGIVMDGRDIGTVVFPNADFKFFVTADIETRAKRRYEELKSKGDKNVSFEEIKANLQKRDRIDSNREHSPLKIADDAIFIDTGKMTREEQLDFVINKILI